MQHAQKICVYPRSHPRLSASIIICVALVFASTVYAQDTYEEAAKMADQIHKKVATDVIYTNQELKALYYQNVQIIELLKEIKELLHQRLIEKETIEVSPR